MNFAGKTLAENLSRNLMSSLGAFSGSRWTKDLYCWFLWLPWQVEVSWQGLGRGGGVEETLIFLHRKRQLIFLGRFLPDQASAEASEEAEVMQGRRRHHRGGVSHLW